MSNRCTKSTLAFKGGQVDLEKYSVWGFIDGKITKINDCLQLKNTVDDIEVDILPHEIKTIEQYKNYPNDKKVKRVTNRKRALGSNHLDTPLGEEEINERKMLIESWSEAIVNKTVTNHSSRGMVKENLIKVLTERFLHCGTDLTLKHLKENTHKATSLPALIRSIEMIPTLAERAGAPSPKGVRSRLDRISQHLQALGPVDGEKPKVTLKIDINDPRSVHPHALARYMERVDDRVDEDIILLTKGLIRSRNSREESAKARSALVHALGARGIDNKYINEVVHKISLSLADPHNKPTFSTSRPHIVGNQHDRAVLIQNIEGVDYEILVRASDSKKLSTDSTVVTLEVITLWPISQISQRKDVWIDDTVPLEYRNEWSLKLQEKLIELARTI